MNDGLFVVTLISQVLKLFAPCFARIVVDDKRRSQL